MEQSRSGQILILILVLAMGIFFEVLKSLRQSQSVTPHPALELDADISPFHITEQQMVADQIAARARHSFGMRLEGGPTKPTKLNSFVSDGAKKAKKKPSKKDAAAKKKTKKAKAKKAAPAQNKTQSNPDNSWRIPADQNPTDQSPDAVQTTGGIVTGTVSTTTNKSPTQSGVGATNSTATYQQWARLLMPTTSQATVQELIQYYQHGQVTATIFYELLSAMAAEPSSSEQLLALYAANATPSSKSFALLAGVLGSSANNSSVVAQDTQYLDNYQTLTALPALIQVFNQNISDQTVIQVAAQILELSTTTNIGKGSSASGASVAQAYAGILPVIQTVMTVYAKNSTITSLMQTSLNLIKGIEPASATS